MVNPTVTKNVLLAVVAPPVPIAAELASCVLSRSERLETPADPALLADATASPARFNAPATEPRSVVVFTVIALLPLRVICEPVLTGDLLPVCQAADPPDVVCTGWLAVVDELELPELRQKNRVARNAPPAKPRGENSAPPSQKCPTCNLLFIFQPPQICVA